MGACYCHGCERIEEMCICDQKSANETQIGGEHYRKFGALQPWDVIKHFDLGFFDGTVVAYLLRWKHKGGVEDLRKARHTLDKLIELESPQ